MDEQLKKKINSLLFISTIVFIMLIILPHFLKKSMQDDFVNQNENATVQDGNYNEKNIEIPENEANGNKYLEKYYPNDKNDPFYREVEKYIKELKNTPRNNLNSKSYIRDNYLPYAAMNDGTIHRFNKKSILIYIPQNRYYKVVNKAFVTYNYQFNGDLLFQETKDPNKTDIKISFVDKLTDSYDNEHVVGLGGAKRFDKAGNIIYSELMVLNKNDKSENPDLTYVYNILLHEIAHCIGISGHSPNSGDIMYKNHSSNAYTEIQKFSKRDIETIRLLYTADNMTLERLLKFSKETKLNENILYAKDSSSSDSYLKVADSYLNMGQYENALKTFKKALEINPKNPRIYHNLAYSYRKMGKYVEAIEILKKAIDAGIVNPDIYNALADCYYEKDDCNNAINFYMQALSLDSESYAAYSGIAECYLKLKTHTKALEYAKIALEKAKARDEKIYANDLVGYIYTKKRDYVSSMQYYKAELELDPKDKETFINYISVCLSARKKEDAKIAYNKYFKYYNPADFNENDRRTLKHLE